MVQDGRGDLSSRALPRKGPEQVAPDCPFPCRAYAGWYVLDIDGTPDMWMICDSKVHT